MFKTFFQKILLTLVFSFCLSNFGLAMYGGVDDHENIENLRSTHGVVHDRNYENPGCFPWSHICAVLEDKGTPKRGDSAICSAEYYKRTGFVKSLTKEVNEQFEIIKCNYYGIYESDSHLRQVAAHDSWCSAEQSSLYRCFWFLFGCDSDLSLCKPCCGKTVGVELVLY